jgi:small conductance mechanosensitive channel
MKLTDHLQMTLKGDSIAALKLGDLLGDLAVNLLLALLILVVTLWLAGRASNLAKRAVGALPRTSDDMTLQSFVGSSARMVVIVIGLIAVLRRLGVETTSIVAVLGAGSLAIGLALQGALSNVAAGVMILILRPYRVGDTVTIAGRTGQVRKLDLFNTELIDGEGLKIIAPNGKSFSDVIVNATDIPNRRVELNFGIDYGDDVGKAIDLALACARADKRVLKNPAPWAKLTQLAASSMILTVRAWTAPGDQGETQVDLLRAIKTAFDTGGIHLPYPIQMTVDQGGVKPPPTEPSASPPQA